VYQSPLRGAFSTSTHGQTSSDPQPPGGLAEGEARLPQAFGAGAAWRPTPRWTVAFDLTWDQWTETLFTPGGGPTISLFDGLPKALSGTRDTLSGNAGAECLFHGEGFVVPLRFGAAWEPQGPRSAYTRDPVNFVMLAAGTGYNTNSLKFDAALQYRWAHFQDGYDFGIGDGDPYRPVAVGEHSAKEWRVKLSVIVRVTDTEKLQRRLKKIFGGA
jgi:long-subunit fatty acid transport protein